jgi:YesN/AraC family two-component response regulator
MSDTGKSGGSPTARRTTILFIDDEQAVLRSIARILARSEFDVMTTSRPEEAFEHLSRNRIDVVVSDIDMPEMNGLDLLERVRTQHPRVLRMLLTGSATVDRALRAINEGEVVRFFRKPFDVELFRRSMEALVQRIESLRAQDAEEERRRRALALQAWVTKRFPDLLEGLDGEPGVAHVDRRRLDEAIANAADPQLQGLLGQSAVLTAMGIATTQEHR